MEPLCVSSAREFQMLRYPPHPPAAAFAVFYCRKTMAKRDCLKKGEEMYLPPNNV
jgi:hypothetical protein